MPNPTTPQPFTRLPVPPGHEPMRPVVGDLYDKLNAIAAAFNQLQTSHNDLEQTVAQLKAAQPATR